MVKVNSFSDAGKSIIEITKNAVKKAESQMDSRSFRAANELTNATMMVLRGKRAGRIYNMPGTGKTKIQKRKGKTKVIYKKYQASAPGESPANRTGGFRQSWKRRTTTEVEGNKSVYKAQTVSNSRTEGKKKRLLGEILEDGTKNMDPRPYHDKVIDRAKRKVLAIYKEPYL